MAAVYPGTVTTLTNPASTDKLNSPSHATQHININDEMEATQGELGIDPAGNHSTVVARLNAMDAKTGVMVFSYTAAAGVANTWWFVSPYACNISGWVSFGVSSGTGRTVAVVHGSAGSNAIATAEQVTTGTVGVAVTLTASATPSMTAQEVMRVTSTSCATAQSYGVTILLARTGTA